MYRHNDTVYTLFQNQTHPFTVIYGGGDTNDEIQIFNFREHFSLSVQSSITVVFKLFSHIPLSQTKHIHVSLP